MAEQDDIITGNFMFRKITTESQDSECRLIELSSTPRFLSLLRIYFQPVYCGGRGSKKERQRENAHKF